MEEKITCLCGLFGLPCIQSHNMICFTTLSRLNKVMIFLVYGLELQRQRIWSWNASQLTYCCTLLWFGTFRRLLVHWNKCRLLLFENGELFMFSFYLCLSWWKHNQQRWSWTVRAILCYFGYNYSYIIRPRNSHYLTNQSSYKFFHHLSEWQSHPGAGGFSDLVTLGQIRRVNICGGV